MSQQDLTPKQLAYQSAVNMTKAEAELAAARLFPQSSGPERLDALFLACMRAGVNLYPNEEGWDGGRGVHFDAVGALVVDEKTDSPASFYVEKVPGAPLADALELVMWRALAFVALSGGEPPKEAVSAGVRAQSEDALCDTVVYQNFMNGWIE